MSEVTATGNGKGSLGILQVDLAAFGSDLPLYDTRLLEELSRGGKRAFFLAYIGNEDRVAYEAFCDGARVGGWEGVRREYPAEVDPTEEDSETSSCRAFAKVFEMHTGTSFEALLLSDAATGILDHEAREGTEAFFVGRSLRIPAGTPKVLNLFRFQDRGRPPLGAPFPFSGDRLAFLALDVAAAWRVLTSAPAGTLAEALARLDENAAFRIGPFSHALPAVSKEALAMPADMPALGCSPSVDFVELIAMAHVAGGTAGDSVAYLDRIFFPLLNVYETGGFPGLDPTELDALKDHGCLTVMAEVLPYAAPEGQLLESFADDELRPLSPSHVKNGEYTGSIFLVSRDRLRGLLRSFDGERFLERLERFMNAWWRTIEPDAPASAYRTWRNARDPLDREDLNHFAQTLVELRAVLGICDENGLELGLVFYGAEE